MQKASQLGGGNLSNTASSTTVPLCRALGIPIYDQQDAQEFWKLLLPELESFPILNLYQGHYETYICALDGTHRERKRLESFLDLSLDVTNFASVQESMEDMFTSGEVLSVEEGNGWRPEKGAEKVDALKGNSMQVGGLPKILQLHLMRFNFDWQTETMNKINDRFHFQKVSI
jgi:ubiquitin C-terminal hydrolase